jgi:16S rRNA G966 N2-methylase RsmD
MAISDAGRKDPSMLGGTHYERSFRDFYPTPARATKAFVSVVEDDLEAMQFWEPFAGNGAIYNVIAPYCRNAGATDIVNYDGFEANGLFDFFNLYADGAAHEVAVAAWERHIDKNTHEDGVYRSPEKANPGNFLDLLAPPARPQSLADVEALLGFRPDAIISNPPYGKDADRAVRKALELMEAETGYVAFLMRHEWDAAKGRADLIDHPAFLAKVTLRFRPVWIDKQPGEKSSSPRFSYAWYIWDWAKAQKAPNAKAEMYYAG